MVAKSVVLDFQSSALPTELPSQPTVTPDHPTHAAKSLASKFAKARKPTGQTTRSEFGNDPGRNRERVGAEPM